MAGSQVAVGERGASELMSTGFGTSLLGSHAISRKNGLVTTGRGGMESNNLLKDKLVLN